MKEVSDAITLTKKQRIHLCETLSQLTNTELFDFDAALNANIGNPDWCRRHGLSYLQLHLGQNKLHAQYHTAREVIGYNTVH